MRLLTPLLAACLLTACATTPVAARQASGEAPRANGTWGPRPPLRVGTAGGPVPTGLDTPFVKDPSFVGGNALFAGRRWIAYGDLRAFYVKPYEASAGRLRFGREDLPLAIDGLPPGVDAPWAPQLVLRGERVLLLYCAGEMPAPEPPRWSTFKLRVAEASRPAFEAALRAGTPPRFADRGALMPDLAPFGAGDRDFGVIDPHLFVNDAGRAYLTYTVVRAGIAGGRPHEEFVRFRRVDPQDPGKALGPDTPLLDGRAGTEADGVAEAQDVLTIGGKAVAVVSIRAGDQDQRMVAAELPRDLAPLTLADMSPLMSPGGEAWKAKAVGSSGSVTIAGTTYMVYQGLGADGRFTLGWTTLERP